MNRVLGFVLFIPAAGATAAALLTILVFLLPGKTGRARHALETGPGRSFVIGLVNFVFFGAIAALLNQGGDFLGLISFLLLLALFGLTLIGMGGLLSLLRHRLYPLGSERSSLPRETINAAILLLLALLTPVAGWFVLAPMLLLLGLGAGIIALIQRSTPATGSDSY
jgi:hypothetical protein